MSTEKWGTSEPHRWRLESSSTLSLHMKHRENVIVISQGFSSSLIQLSQEPLSKNGSRLIDWKSLQWHQSTFCLYSVLYFLFFLQLSKRGIVSLLFLESLLWAPIVCAAESSFKSCLRFYKHTLTHSVFFFFFLTLISLIVPPCLLCFHVDFSLIICFPHFHFPCLSYWVICYWVLHNDVFASLLQERKCADLWFMFSSSIFFLMTNSTLNYTLNIFFIQKA